MFTTNKAFADRLVATKSIFSKALDDSRKLSEEMKERLEELEAERISVKSTKKETDSFIENLSRLV